MTAGRDTLGNSVSTADPAILTGLDAFVEGFLAYETRAAGILATAAAARAGWSGAVMPPPV